MGIKMVPLYRACLTGYSDACVPQKVDLGRTGAVAGSSPSCGMIVA
jgi:hypothetical protein